MARPFPSPTPRRWGGLSEAGSQFAHPRPAFAQLGPWPRESTPAASTWRPAHRPSPTSARPGVIKKVKVEAHYLGGHPLHEKEVKEVTAVFDDEGFRTKLPFNRPIWVRNWSVPWQEIGSVEVDGPDEVTQRVTGTRLLTTGVFAFAFKKKQKVAYFTVTTGEGEMIFEVKGMTVPELRARLSAVCARAG